MTLVYDSSQSAILSLGENTGQLSGNFRYGMWSYQTGSCRQSDLYRLRHWSPGRARLSMTIVGTLSCRSLAASPMPAWPPPTISTYGCSVTPRFWRSASRASRQVVPAPVAPRSVLAAERPPFAVRLLVARELVEGGEQGPALAAVQPQVAVSPADRGLEVDPGLGDAVGLGGFLAVGDRPAGGLHPRQRGFEHAGDIGAALEG